MHKIGCHLPVVNSSNLIAVGLVNHKVTEFNGLEDPSAFGTSLVWHVSVFQVLAHNLNQTWVM